MAPWLIAVLRAIGIRSAADVVPVAREIAETVSDAVNLPEPAQPLSYADVRWIEAQKASATAHKVTPPTSPGQGTRAVAAASAPAAGAVCEAPRPRGAGAEGTQGGRPLPPPRRGPGLVKAVDRSATTPRQLPPKKEPKK